MRSRRRIVHEKVEKPVEESIAVRQATQKDVENWVEERSGLEARYDALLERKRQLVRERDRLARETEDLERRVAAAEMQIESMEKISGDLAPFLEKIHDRLALLIEQPPPFLIAERTARLQGLRQTLDDTGIAPGEKFRKVMEALSIEAEYGNTVEVYQEKVRFEEREVLADVFRLGTVALFFETLDQGGAGYFDLAENKWKPLPKEAIRDVHAAMEIASRRRPAEIVDLPLGRIVVK